MTSRGIARPAQTGCQKRLISFAQPGSGAVPTPDRRHAHHHFDRDAGEDQPERWIGGSIIFASIGGAAVWRPSSCTGQGTLRRFPVAVEANCRRSRVAGLDHSGSRAGVRRAGTGRQHHPVRAKPRRQYPDASRLYRAGRQLHRRSVAGDAGGLDVGDGVRAQRRRPFLARPI